VISSGSAIAALFTLITDNIGVKVSVVVVMVEVVVVGVIAALVRPPGL